MSRTSDASVDYDGEQATVNDQPNNALIVSKTVDALIGAGTDSANEIAHFLGEMASLAKSGDPQALFKLGIRFLDSKDLLLAKAFLTVLTEKYPDLYFVANLELARLLRDEGNFDNAEKHYILADWKGCD
jgi:predicted negative regulator of RcsB-dependent stress response